MVPVVWYHLRKVDGREIGYQGGVSHFKLILARIRLQEATRRMSVSRDQFDTDLRNYTNAVSAYEAAVGAYTAAVKNAAPDLAVEDQEVGAAATALASAQSDLAAAANPAAPDNAPVPPVPAQTGQTAGDGAPV